MSIHPQIAFRHVLGELSANRNDPCEVIRELISNSYDAKATEITYAPYSEEQGFIFFDNGSGLSLSEKSNDITPYEAFFSIGKSTKRKGDAIGYKCQGSKLCFACSRILVITKTQHGTTWLIKIIENPRQTLSEKYDLTPIESMQPWSELNSFFTSTASEIQKVLGFFSQDFFEKDFQQGTMLVIQGLDTENFKKHFLTDAVPEPSYIYNYIRHHTKHGDTRHLSKDHGFTPNHITQLSKSFTPSKLNILINGILNPIPDGYPYLKVDSSEDVKSPAKISRLRDGRFHSRHAKSFTISGQKFSVILAIDGNKRAHENYNNLDRKGGPRSGIRLIDQRGLFISVNGIKICRHLEIFNNSDLSDYEILAEGDSPSHYTLIIDGNFDLITNRNSLSRNAFETLSNPDLLKQIKKFLDDTKKSDPIFRELVSRLKKESTETRLNDQISILDSTKEKIKKRERFRIKTDSGSNELYLCPLPGEEYLVGVLYATLRALVNDKSPQKEKWKKILTFSTQGIDSIGMNSQSHTAPLTETNLLAIEYKYNFNNQGPFNHALAITDYIVAWEVDLNEKLPVKDGYTCFGKAKKITDGHWEIYDIENEDGGTYPNSVTVLELRKLIIDSLNPSFTTP